MSIGPTAINLSITTVETPQAGTSLADGSFAQALAYSVGIPTGTASGQADQVWTSSRTVNGGANDDIDIIGTLQSAVGGPVTPARVVAIGITNLSKTTGDKLVIGNGANPFFAGLFPAGAGQIVVGAGGAFFWASPVDPATCTAGTADILRINNPGGTPVACKLILVTRSA